VLGNTIANAGIVTLVLWMVWHNDWAVGWVMFWLLWALLLGCEAAPKTLAVRAPAPWSRRVARPMLLLQNASRPLRQVAQYLTNAVLDATGSSTQAASAGLTDAEYKELVETAFQQGADGVLVCGCHPGDCHYKEGNYKGSYSKQARRGFDK